MPIIPTRVIPSLFAPKPPKSIIPSRPPPGRRTTFDKFVESEPIHVSAQVILQPGATQAPNAIALQNPNGAPMEIFEIATTLVTETSNGSNSTNHRITGAAVGLKLDLGNFPISKDFAPLSVFGPARNLLSESPLSSPGYGGPYMTYVWKLPVPILVPAGGVLMPQLQHRNLTNDPITVTIGYSGRSLAPGTKPPRRAKLPYVASWVSKAFDGLGAQDTDASTETDLVNLLNTPIRVEQIIGRVNSILNSTGESYSILPADVAFRLLTCRIDGSRGQRIVPGYTPFSQIWSMQDAVFPGGFDLEAGGFLRVLAKKLAPPNQSAGTWSSQMMAALIGWREVGG